MFDILCDVWKRPGAAHSPVLPVDASTLNAETAEHFVSRLHKCGIDALILSTRDGTVSYDVLDAVFSAASRRAMLIYVHESLVQVLSQTGDEELVKYNPMLEAHTLRISPREESVIGHFEELVCTYYLKFNDGVLADASSDAVDESYAPYDVILTKGKGLDLLGFATGEVIASSMISFALPLREKYAGTLAGIVTSRLTECKTDALPWSYDMTELFFALGGTPLMLASLITGADKRTVKEAHRVYVKTLASRLDKFLVTPMLNACLENSLALAGEVPADFIASCAGRFTLPIFDETALENTEGAEYKNTYVKCIADVARGAGSTGVACKCRALDHDSLYKEALEYFTSSASHVILPEDFSALTDTESSNLTYKELKDYFTRFARLSTLFTSSSEDSHVAVLCDDGFVPAAAAAKLDALGYSYSFVSLSQAMERGSCKLGEFLLDKYTFNTMFIEPRVRLTPEEVQHIAPFAAYGGQMYRGAAFGTFASKHLKAPCVDKELLRSIKAYPVVKCGVSFTLIQNITDAPLKLDVSRFAFNNACVMSDVDGISYTAEPSSDGTRYVRVMPHEALAVADETKGTEYTLPSLTPVKEILSLKNAENSVFFREGDYTRAVVEMDTIGEKGVRLSVNGETLDTILAPPYRLDITPLLKNGENVIELVCYENVRGAVVRLY